MAPIVAPRVARVLAAAFLCLAGARSSAGAAPAADIPRVLRDWTALDTACRGGRGDDPATLAACDRREAVHRRLTASGWCYGRPGEPGARRAWQACAGPRR